MITSLQMLLSQGSRDFCAYGGENIRSGCFPPTAIFSERVECPIINMAYNKRETALRWGPILNQT